MKKKLLIVLLVLIFLYCIGGVIYSLVVKQNNQKNDNSTKIITINNYEYSFDEKKESTLYKQEFNVLKNNLESSEVNKKDYATSIAKLYIIDLYTLNTKVNKYDITSNQYVFLPARENFNLKVSETIYKYIEDNSNGREQELPEVSEVIVKELVESTYLIGSNEYQAYVVNVEWFYKKDLGYDTEALITLINENNIISVVEENREETTNNDLKQ